MKHSSKPPRGTRDILPDEAEARTHALSTILESYRRFGFRQIETPGLERLALLGGSEGGENEKLIFKLLKRGEKLDKALATLANSPGGSGGRAPDADTLADLGLRFDLTVPLARYYAEHRAELPRVFKAIQVGPVWRAERPQRGRYRQFVQCDIDVMGLEAPAAEVELIEATAETLLELGFQGFTVRINDRRILRGLASGFGFPERAHGAVFITLDKLDKIGPDGVREELTAGGHAADAIDALAHFLSGVPEVSGGRASEGEASHRAVLPEFLDESSDGAAGNAVMELNRVLETIHARAAGRYRPVFDPTLVRGMGYYTGQIFEVRYGEYGYSIAGGGRYDRMIGRFTGRDVPACGFSIGFERILPILMDEGLFRDSTRRRVALLYDTAADPLPAVLDAAASLRAAGHATSPLPRARKLGKQLWRLRQEGYDRYLIFDAAAEAELQELDDTSE